MDSASLDADAGAYGVDAVVVAFHGYLSALAGDAGHAADGDQAVVHLGNLVLEQAGQEAVVGAGDDHLRVVVGVVDGLDNGAHHVALVEEVAGDLLVLGHEQLVLIVVQQEHLALPDLAHLAEDDLALLLLELGVDGVLLQVEDLGL